MIKVQCVTNLDDYQRYGWPTELTCKPAIGELIYTRRNSKCLKVVAIRHKSFGLDNGLFTECIPYLEIELNH
jgi:hypothetical protein